MSRRYIIMYEVDEDYLNQYEKQSKQGMYQEARKWGRFAAWDVISRYLNENDIDFMREFRRYIHWDLIPDEVRDDPIIQLEFKKDIEEGWEEEPWVLEIIKKIKF